MEAYKMLFLIRDLMKSMSEIGVKMDDYKYIGLCQEYNELVSKGALGAKPKEIRRTKKLLKQMNKGFAFSSSSLRMSVLMVGDATSLEQWWDTLSHEIDHLQDAVMKYYDVEPGTEDAAWLQGYIMRLIVKSMKDDGTI